MSHDARIRIRVESARDRATFERLIKVERVTSRSVRLPAGKSGLITLDESLVADTDAPQFLFVESDAEGAEYWPIDSPTPAVDPDTIDFGYLLDLEAPVFSHDHANFSVIAVDHDVTGTRLFNAGVFPYFLENKYEKDNWPAIKNLVSADTIHKQEYLTRATSRVTSRGLALSLNWDGVPDNLGDARAFHYMLGPDDYLNLGTEHDGLRFYGIGYFSGAADLAGGGFSLLRFGCYPYCTKLLRPEDIPATTGTGETIWSPTDRNLCFKHTGPVTDLYKDAGFQATDATAGWELAKTFYQAWAFPKKPDFTKLNVQSETAMPFPLTTTGFPPVWSRITKIHYRVAYALVGGPTSLLANIWFGPPPGQRRFLRPFDLQTEKAWAVGSMPAIGVRNSLGHAVNVRATFGTL